MNLKSPKATASVSHILDRDVDSSFDAELRAMLQLCFPHEARFASQRFYHDSPKHRFCIRQNSILIAHIAVHEKTITVSGVKTLIAGIAEVMVHPEQRGKALVKQMLHAIDVFFVDSPLQYSLLFGKPEVYASAGYHTLPNRIRYFDDKESTWVTKTVPFAMGKTQDGRDFPSGDIDLHGPLF